jgi:hypothetical protein
VRDPFILTLRTFPLSSSYLPEFGTIASRAALNFHIIILSIVGPEGYIFIFVLFALKQNGSTNLEKLSENPRNPVHPCDLIERNGLGNGPEYAPWEGTISQNHWEISCFP